MVNKNNFMIFSKANFKSYNENITNWDFISFKGSKYKYTNEGVYRLSNHFTNKISSCSWLLDNKEYIGNQDILGFCAWKDFQFKTPIIILDRNFRQIKELAIDSLNHNQLKAMSFNCKFKCMYQNETFLNL